MKPFLESEQQLEKSAEFLDVDKPIEVYRNLRKKCWSVRQDGIVRYHTDYVFMRDAYLQNRRAKVGRSLGKEEQAEIDDDLYYFDDEEIEREDYDQKLEQKIEEDSNALKADPSSGDATEVAP